HGRAVNCYRRDCEAEARPPDETAEAEQGQRSAFCKPAATAAAKAGNRNHQGGRNFCRAIARRNGFPLKRGAFATRFFTARKPRLPAGSPPSPDARCGRWAV